MFDGVIVISYQPVMLSIKKRDVLSWGYFPQKNRWGNPTGYACQQHVIRYLATLSSHLSIASMVNMEMRQAATKTIQVAVIEKEV